MSEAISRPRWVAKKLGRAAVALGSWASGGLVVRERARVGPAVRVLTYHRFGAGVREPFRVSAAAFEAQVRFLAERGLALSLDELGAFLEGRLAPRPGSVVLTIDDGSVSVHRIALPILRRHRVPAALFVVAGAVGSERGFGAGGREPYVDWGELEELAASGVSIQSHSMSHRSMTAIGPAQAREEAWASKALIEDRLGREVTSFAYPFGTRADVDAATSQILLDLGYRTVFTSRHGAIGPGDDRGALPRVKIEGGEPMALFRLALRGGLDGWGLVDRWLPALQARRPRHEAEPRTRPSAPRGRRARRGRDPRLGADPGLSRSDRGR